MSEPRDSWRNYVNHIKPNQIPRNLTKLMSPNVNHMNPHQIPRYLTKFMSPNDNTTIYYMIKSRRHCEDFKKKLLVISGPFIFSYSIFSMLFLKRLKIMHSVVKFVRQKLRERMRKMGGSRWLVLYICIVENECEDEDEKWRDKSKKSKKRR